MTALLTATIRSRQDIVALLCCAALPAAACLDALCFVHRILSELVEDVVFTTKPYIGGVALGVAQLCWDTYVWTLPAGLPAGQPTPQALERDPIDLALDLEEECTPMWDWTPAIVAENDDRPISYRPAPTGDFAPDSVCVGEDAPAIDPDSGLCLSAPYMPSAAHNTSDTSDAYLEALPTCKVCKNRPDECTCGDEEYAALAAAEAVRMDEQDQAYLAQVNKRQRASLSKLTVKQLRGIAAEQCITVPGKMKKADIIALIATYA